MLRKYPLILIIACYIIFGILLLDNIYKYHINTDATSYITIAEKYAVCNFHDAVNNHWSPLISWLMTPFILLDVDPLVAFKVINLIAGIFAFIVLKNLFQDFSIPEDIAHVMLLGLIPVFYAFTLITVNPDFLLAVILLFYTRNIISFDYEKSVKNGFICGCLGAVAYFTKGFAFPFFIIHFTAINLFQYLAMTKNTDKKKLLSRFFLGILSFFLIAAPWLYIMYAKYDILTFSTAGSFNLNLIHNNWQNPIDYSGFIEPPNPTAVSAWEYPPSMPADTWIQLNSSGIVKNTIAVIIKNIFNVINVYQESSVFSITILFFTIFFLMDSLKEKLREVFKSNVFLMLCTVAIYTIGYLPLLITKRYLYLVVFLIFVLGGYLICRYDFGGTDHRNIMIGCLCFSFMFMPLRDLRANINIGKDIYVFSQSLAKLGIAGRIASNGHSSDSIYASYHLHAKYYGVIKPGIGYSELVKELKKYQINYYFCWQDKQCHLKLSNYPEISDGRLNNLRIYKIAESN